MTTRPQLRKGSYFAFRSLSKSYGAVLFVLQAVPATQTQYQMRSNLLYGL